MLTRKPAPWQAKPDEITPKSLFLNRRNIISGVGALGVTGLVGCGASETSAATSTQSTRPVAGALEYAQSAYSVSDPQTPFNAVTGYNNFYEFGTGKDDPARYAHAMSTSPWSVEIEGHAANTGTFSLADLIDFSRLEERIYRLRCVEAWSMVVPWVGVPLADVLRRFAPTEEARYVQFVSYANRDEMRGVRSRVLDWPYVEGLRMDEAMNELAFMAVGLYGETLPNQNGAPMRLVVPWKYGYKSAKSIVKIRFVADEPATSWNRSAPREYGFYSNVNPSRAHPRWSQASERVIGGGVFARRETEMFNGYSEQVAHLYDGMDLIENH
jgi:sulfoxide reductase catalytic subunit YedY